MCRKHQMSYTFLFKRCVSLKLLFKRGGTVSVRNRAKKKTKKEKKTQLGVIKSSFEYFFVKNIICMGMAVV